MSYSSNPHSKPADKAPPRPEGHQSPVLSLPKGGGALRSIGEKFSVNPANGTSSLGLAEQSAAQKTALYDSTPATAHADSQGRTIYAVAHNRFIDRLTSTVTEEFYGTRSELDVEGNLLALYDPRGNAVMRYAYD